MRNIQTGLRSVFLTDMFHEFNLTGRVKLLLSLPPIFGIAFTRALTPVLLACAVTKFTDSPDTLSSPFRLFQNTPFSLLNKFGLGELGNASPQTLLIIWAVLRSSEPVFKEINNLIIADLQVDFINRLAGDNFIKKLHTVEMRHLDETYKPGETAQLMTRSTEQISSLMSKTLNQFWPLIATVALASTTLNVDVSSDFMGAMIGFVVLYSVLRYYISTREVLITNKTQEKNKIFSTALREDLTNMSTIRAYNRSGLHARHEVYLFEQFTNQIRRCDAEPALWKLFSSVLFVGANVGALYWLNPNNADQLDETIIVINYLSMLRFALDDLCSNITGMRLAIEGIDKMKQLATLSDERLSPDYCNRLLRGNTGLPSVSIDNPLLNAIVVSGSPPIIEFRNVNYSVDIPGGTKTILNNVSFSIMRGESCALVGDSGSGKSTALRLMCGYYKPTSGSILVNGRDIHSGGVYIDHLRRMISLVQDNQVFFCAEAETRLAYNILYGDFSESELDVIRRVGVLTPAQRTLFARKRENLLLGATSEELGKPSDGEKQKISIARGWQAKPIMILDEPTSALDPRAESDIITKFNNLRWVGARDTMQAVVVVAHRLGTIRRCDKVLFFSRAQITESGKHEALVARAGAYNASYEAQVNGPSL